MRRIYFSPYVLEPNGPGGYPHWIPKVMQTMPGASVGSIMPIDGGGEGKWALCQVDADDHTAAAADVDNDQLPDLTLDTTLSVLTSQQRSRVLGMLTRRGVDTAGLGVNSTFGEVIQRAGDALMPGQFNLQRFDALTR